MATANSAQREPSMEEILASIRRIIEDSDGGRRQPADAVESAAAVETVEYDAAIESPAPEVDVFRAELRADNEAEPAPKKPISLAEVQAHLTSAPLSPFGRDGTFRTDPAGSGFAAVAEAEARGASYTSDAAMPDAEAENGTPQQRAETVEPAAFSEPMAPEAVADDLTGAQIEIDDNDLDLADEPTVQAAIPGQALVSEETSRQVAAAFGELSEAFAARGKKSFDDMAEDMLRPMLQDWLDNNLPTLVERLVREEIERVARGAA